MWSAVRSDDGRTYFWNQYTDEVKWENPLENTGIKHALVNSIALCDDFAKIHMNHCLLTCLRIGIDVRLRNSVEEWKTCTFYPPEVKVKTLITSLNSWFEMKCERDIWKRIAREELDDCDSQLNVVRAYIDNLMKQLVSVKTRLATTEYHRLKSKTRSSL